MKAAEIRVSLQKPLQYKHPAMAPTLTPVMTSSQDHVTLTHKLRKPLVEKIHRERINSSIEQLKSLLGPEFLKQQPDSKLEKADILAYCKDELHISSEGNLSEADFSPLIVTAKDKSPVYSSLCWPW